MREFAHRSKQKETRQPDMHQQGKASGIPNSALEAVMAGQARASSEMMGHRQDLAPSLAAKMSKAFGMDLSQVQVYRSGAMSGTETQGMASGNKIVLSKDIDLNTITGQAVLGHEISHVRAQSQGIGMGNTGLYQNAGLEHQADVEGYMAARGMSILGESTGMEMGLGMGGIGGLTPLGAGMNASAGAPMQAKGKGKGKKAAAPVMTDETYEQTALKDDFLTSEDVDSILEEREMNKKTNEIINGVQWKNGEDDETFGENMKKTKYGLWVDFVNGGGKGNEQRSQMMQEAFIKAGGEKGKMFGVAMIDRLIWELAQKPGDNTSDEDLVKLMQNMASKDKDKQKQAKLMIKEMHYQELLRRQNKYGSLLEQMSPEDIAERGGQEGFAADINYGLQMGDVNQETHSYKDGAKFDDPEKEAHYNALRDYYSKFNTYYQLWALNGDKGKDTQMFKQQWLDAQMMGEGDNKKKVIQSGPSLSKEQLKLYKKNRKK